MGGGVTDDIGDGEAEATIVGPGIMNVCVIIEFLLSSSARSSSCSLSALFLAYISLMVIYALSAKNPLDAPALASMMV